MPRELLLKQAENQIQIDVDVSIREVESQGPVSVPDGCEDQLVFTQRLTLHRNLLMWSAPDIVWRSQREFQVEGLDELPEFGLARRSHYRLVELCVRTLSPRRVVGSHSFPERRQTRFDSGEILI